MRKLEIDSSDWFKVKMWLTELKVLFECESEKQPADMQQVYLDKAKEISDFLDKPQNYVRKKRPSITLD